MTKKKITSVSTETWSRVLELRDEWLTVGLSTEPADRGRALAGVAAAYGAINQQAPPVVVWMDSPLGGCLASAVLRHGFQGRVRDQLGQLRGQLGDQLRGQLGQLRGQLGDQLRGQLGDQLGDQLDQLGQLGGQLGDQLGDQLGQLRDQLFGQLGGQLRDQLFGHDQLGQVGQLGQLRGQLGQLRDQLGDQLDQLGDQLRGGQLGQLRGQLADQLGGQLRDQLFGQLGDQLFGQLRGQLYASWWGSWDAYWLAWLLAAELCGVKYDVGPRVGVGGMADVSRSAGWWWPMKGAIVLTDRPKVIARDERGRLHSTSGPALLYRDGYVLWAVHGVRVDERIVEHPETITPEEIYAEANTERRRVMLEQFGWERFVTTAALRLVDEAPDPANAPFTLQLYDLPEAIYDEPVRLLLVHNATPERTGERRRYGLTTPADMPDALTAAAWTYGLGADQYRQLQRAT